jgi:UDP-N-acetylmuramyl pentapeptide synthase
MKAMDLSQSLTGFVNPDTFAVGPSPRIEPATLVHVSGATLMHAANSSPASAEAALKTLRDARAVRRRVVWLNSSELARTPNADLRSWGRKLVDIGRAELVVVNGVGAREAAIAARDAGLAIGRVVVCLDEATARNVLTDSVAAGDTILALGTSAESCYKLAERMETRFERDLLVA